ncbi:hypothetical protein [Streptomyces anulatus]|uniref:hypothetical protein n=1 Tax=Streptomyces anulatus TaxID=1892 RepID=UPI003CC914F6
MGSAETLRNWVKQGEVDSGRLPGTTTEESAQLKALKKENAEVQADYFFTDGPAINAIIVALADASTKQQPISRWTLEWTPRSDVLDLYAVAAQFRPVVAVRGQHEDR